MAIFFFPRATLKKMVSLGLSETKIKDAFYNGRDIPGKSGRVKKYSGYEVGLFYLVDKTTGENIVTAVWKKERR